MKILSDWTYFKVAGMTHACSNKCYIYTSVLLLKQEEVCFFLHTVSAKGLTPILTHELVIHPSHLGILVGVHLFQCLHPKKDGRKVSETASCIRKHTKTYYHARKFIAFVCTPICARTKNRYHLKHISR